MLIFESQLGGSSVYGDIKADADFGVLLLSHLAFFRLDFTLKSLPEQIGNQPPRQPEKKNQMPIRV